MQDFVVKSFIVAVCRHCIEHVLLSTCFYVLLLFINTLAVCFGRRLKGSDLVGVPIDQ